MVDLNKDTEKTIYGGNLADSNLSLCDNRSTRRIIHNKSEVVSDNIQVNHQI